MYESTAERSPCVEILKQDQPQNTTKAYEKQSLYTERANAIVSEGPGVFKMRLVNECESCGLISSAVAASTPKACRL